MTAQRHGRAARVVFAVGRWLTRCTGLAIVRVRVVVEPPDAQAYAQGYADAAAYRAGRPAPARPTPHHHAAGRLRVIHGEPPTSA